MMDFQNVRISIFHQYPRNLVIQLILMRRGMFVRVKQQTDNISLGLSNSLTFP